MKRIKVKNYRVITLSLLLGLSLWGLIQGGLRPGFADLLVRVMIMAMVASPITGLLLSCPWRKPSPAAA